MDLNNMISKIGSGIVTVTVFLFAVLLIFIFISGKNNREAYYYEDRIEE